MKMGKQVIHESESKSASDRINLDLFSEVGNSHFSLF